MSLVRLPPPTKQQKQGLGAETAPRRLFDAFVPSIAVLRYFLSPICTAIALNRVRKTGQNEYLPGHLSPPSFHVKLHDKSHAPGLVFSE